MSTYKELIIQAFEKHNGSMTLGELLDEGRYTFGHSLTARLTDLRKDGYVIKCERGESPSKNVYTMIPPVKFDAEGQGSFV